MTDPVISDAVVEAARAVIREMCGKHMEPDNDVMIAALIAAILADRAETVEACLSPFRRRARAHREIAERLDPSDELVRTHNWVADMYEEDVLLVIEREKYRYRVPCVPSNKDAGE